MQIPKFRRATDEDRAASGDEGRPKSRRTKFLQGAAVFVVMFVALRWLLSRGDERAE